MGGLQFGYTLRRADQAYELDAAIEGGEVSTAFNCGYLIDAINALKNKDVTLNFVQNGKPAIISEGDFIHVVTPVTKG